MPIFLGWPCFEPFCGFESLISTAYEEDVEQSTVKTTAEHVEVR